MQLACQGFSGLRVGAQHGLNVACELQKRPTRVDVATAMTMMVVYEPLQA